MVPRNKYLDELKAFQDIDVIKVVTGVRRSGKSTLLELMRDDLLAQGKQPDDIFFYKMESMRFDALEDYRQLYDLVIEETKGSEHPYLFFDELQDVQGWERAINALRVDLDADIYITGSNAYLLSSELAILISGRYVEVEVLPLTFAEYLEFRGYETFSKESDKADLAMRGNDVASLDAIFSQYRRYGGFPYLALREPNQTAHRRYLKSLYDIKGKELLKTLGQHYIADVGFRSYLEGYRESDPGRALENIVYLQLRYDGYDVNVGKLRGGEVDFVAQKDNATIYIQVTEDMSDPDMMHRELKPPTGRSRRIPEDGDSRSRQLPDGH